MTADVTYYAIFQRENRTYTITWYNYDGTLIGSNQANYNDTPSPKTPTKTPGSGYTFYGWSPTITPVTGDASYYAVYKGSATTVTKGGITLTKQAIPTGDNTWQLVLTAKSTTYTKYTGGDTVKDVVDAIKKDTGLYYLDNGTYYLMSYTTNGSGKKYTIKYNNTIIVNNKSSTTSIITNMYIKTTTTAANPLTTGSVLKDVINSTYFDYSNISATVSTSATVSEVSCTRNGDTVTVTGFDYSSGGTLTLTISGITGKQNGNVQTAVNTNASGSGVYDGSTEKATFTSPVVTILPKYYTVTWKDDDGTILKVDKVKQGDIPNYGSIPVKPQTAQYTYTFSGWTPTVSTVTGDVTYTANYIQAARTYTITWQNYDGTVLETDNNVEYGATPSYDGDDPTKEQNGNTVYTFTDWTPAIESVTGNQVYTAVYSEQTVKNYNLTSRDITINLNADGTVKDFEGAGTIHGSVGYEGNGIYWVYPYYEFTLNGESQETKFIFESDNESVIDNDNDIDYWFSFTENPGTTQLTLKAVGLVQGSTKVLATTTITVTVNKDEPEIVLTGIDTKNTVAYIMLGVPIFAAGVYFILSVRKKRITSV